MFRSTLLALLSLGMIPTIACTDDLETPGAPESLGTAEAALGLPPICYLEDVEPPPDLCSWKNGWVWPNGFQKPVSDQPDVGWRATWRNRSQDKLGTAGGVLNSWALAFDKAWGSILKSDWQFPTNAFRWVAGSTTCAHPISQIGGVLEATCNPVVTSTCSSKGGIPGCCDATKAPGSWDASCVDHALALAAVNPGNHSVVDLGGPLPKYDPPIFTTGFKSLVFGGIGLPGTSLFAYNECADLVCKDAEFASCCTQSWAPKCVTQAVQQCSSQYLARPRVELGRVLVDACVEPRVAGFAGCPVGYETANGKECCRTAMALRGVYQAVDTNSNSITEDDRTGRRVHWYERRYVNKLVSIGTTIVPDPCDTLADGTRSCEWDNVSKLWHAAGPSGPLFPDCKVDASDDNDGDEDPADNCGCGNLPRANGEACAPAPHQDVGMRHLLATTLSALITTNGHHEVWFSWKNGGHEPWGGWGFADIHPQEAEWRYKGVGEPGTTSYQIQTEPACYGSSAPQRANNYLVGNVEPCPVNDDVLAGSVLTWYGDLLLSPG